MALLGSEVIIMVLNASSINKLKKVHPDLVKVVYRTAKLITNVSKDKSFGFIITCGVRTLEEQKKLLKAGATTTLNSRHIPGKDGYSKAVDFAVTLDGKIRWDWPLYSRLAELVKEAARLENVHGIEWGGDWKTFKDGPHFQLNKIKYP
jgi:peptidoglycan L-alanyl-D-glutamate endopeptidase CwlK